MKVLALMCVAMYSVATLANHQELTALFTKNYEAHYESGECGFNIKRLLRAAEENQIPIAHARVLTIANKGFSLFGLVNVEAARGHRDGEKNWYYHVFLEYDGKIYDYDFTDEANVKPVSEYFQAMFFNETPESEKSSGQFYIGQEKKKADYQMEVYLADEYLHLLSSGQLEPLETLSLGEYLEDWE